MSDPGMTQDRGDEAGTSTYRKLLGILGCRIVALLGSLVRNAHLHIGAAYMILFAVVVSFLFAGGLLDPVAEWIRSARDQDAFGKIMVESPEVYTRERLVNDRLRQTVWLRKQMRATENVLKEGYFRSHEGLWTQDVSAMMSANLARDRGVGRNGNGKGTNVAQTDAGPTVKRKNGNVGAAMDPTETGASIELFRAMNEYREQIRAELMQTQLDDRHDIDGNTLYRLNFNTTVVHGRRSDALAVILIKLQHSESREDGGGRLYKELLRDWAQELERRLNAAALHRMERLMSPDVPDRAADATEFFLWLRWKICRKLTQISASLSDSEGGVSDPSPATIGAVRKWFKVDARDCGEKYYHNLGQGGNDGADPRIADATNRGLGEKLDSVIGDYVDRYRNARRDQDLFSKYVDARPELVKEISTQAKESANKLEFIVRNPLDFFRELGKRWCRTIVIQHFQARGTPGKQSPAQGAPGHGAANGLDPDQLKNEKRHIREMNLVRPLCTPGPPSPIQQSAIIAVMDLYWRLERLEKKLSSNSEEIPNDTDRLDVIDCRETTRAHIEKFHPEHAKYDSRSQELSWLKTERKAMKKLLNNEDGMVCMLETPSRLWRRNLGIQQQVDQFNREFIDGGVTESEGTGVLEEIVTVEEVGCEAALCRISVKTNANAEDPAECFYHTLDKDFEVFSYGVSPKNWSQRLAFSGSTIRSMAVALETPTLPGTENKVGLFESANRERETLRSVMSQPIVVGFGRGRTKHRTHNPQNERGAKCGSVRNETNNGNAQGDGNGTDSPKDEPYLSRGTEFGWFIAPEKRWGDGGGTWHPHRQYDLSAVISIPSWWRRVKLTASTCWRKLSDLEDLGNEYIDRCGRGENDGVDEGSGRGEDDSYFIKLPGDVGEVSRKFRIEVRDVPYILTKLYNSKFGQYVFHVGERAEIVIEGGRLWRSTRVTMGTQPADEITVLPHMEGIVATFDCVRRPPYSQMPEDLARSIYPDKGKVYKAEVYVAPLQVWTSEGVTTPPLPVNIVEVDPKNAKRCSQDADSSQLASRGPPNVPRLK